MPIFTSAWQTNYSLWDLSGVLSPCGMENLISVSVLLFSLPALASPTIKVSLLLETIEAPINVIATKPESFTFV
jgi:hypothetical protein